MVKIEKKYRLDELISKFANKSEVKKELASAMNISVNRLNTLCRSTFSDDVNIKTDQAHAAAKYFEIEIGAIFSEMPKSKSKRLQEKKESVAA